MTVYPEHVEIKPHEWARIWAETAPQARNTSSKKTQRRKDRT